jgi:hypothetical protein
VDSAEWSFGDWPENTISDAIEHLIECVWTARDRDEVVWIGDDLQTQRVLGEHDLWSLFSPDAPIKLSPELRQELAAWLGPALHYLDEEEWPPGMEETNIQVDNEMPAENTDQAWAHHHVRSGRPVACLSIRRYGPHDTVSTLGSATVHWIVDESTRRTFWREAVEVEGGSAEALERLSAHAFPDLYFHTGVWQGLNKFAGGYLAVRCELQRYLAVLDQHGIWAFSFPPPALALGEPAGPDPGAIPSNQIIERRFHGLNLDVSPENSNVRADNDCRRAREITVGTLTLYCQWHGKLERHRNRIYMHPPVTASKHKLVIAIFTDHLALP